MANGKYTLDNRVNVLARRILDSSGNNPITFFDTGAIIDFEKEVSRNLRLIDKRITPSTFYESFRKKVHPIFVTEHVMEEVVAHNKYHKLNEIPEISNETFNIVTGMHRDYCEFLRSISSNGLDIEQVRYDVYWAGKMAFDLEHKKCCRDPISRVDREQLAAALWAKYSCVQDNSGKDRCVSSSIIVSPDCHLVGTTKILLSDHEFNSGYHGIKVVSSR